MSGRLSIIIPVLNRATLVQRAIASVIEQDVDGIEIIAVDGGSSDGTQEVISSFAAVRLLHAPKSSIYQALNLGIKAAQAPIIGHLNSDDRIPPNALSAVLDAAVADPAAMILRGRALFIESRGGAEVQQAPKYSRAVSHKLDVRGITFGVPAINCCFVRARAYQSIGGYDETFQIAADREWLFRAVLAKMPIHLLEQPVYEYMVHDDSLTISNLPKIQAQYAREHLHIAERFLRQPLDAQDLHTLRSWHAQEVVRLLRWEKSSNRLISEIWRAFRTSLIWPIWSIAPTARALLRQLKER